MKSDTDVARGWLLKAGSDVKTALRRALEIFEMARGIVGAE